MERCQVAVIGSGFAGSILARILHGMGLQVALLERERHPRFALGESSTPLAALSLERLARRYEMPDLAWLAAYGRWSAHLPELRRGLKRGFTFYRHSPGAALERSLTNANRLLVAASPEDAVADSHWLREDVDHFLVRRAMADGVPFHDRVKIQALRREGPKTWLLEGLRRGESFEIEAQIVVDASGAGGFLRGMIPIESELDTVELDTALVFGHFEKLGHFPELDGGPYPDHQAAIHHLLEEGWMYVLPFDHGVASAGILLRRSAVDSLAAKGCTAPDAIWKAVTVRYPTLRDQFGGSRQVRPLEIIPRVQRLLARAAGDSWVLLPHSYSFLDPMFSTGIAWSLLAVERLAWILTESLSDGQIDRGRVAAGFDRYHQYLRMEAMQMKALLEGAYLAMGDFELFTAQSFLYFATVSYEEVGQRIHPEGRSEAGAPWRGFLAADDEQMRQLFAESKHRLTAIRRDESGRASSEDAAGFSRWIADQIAARNVVGLADPSRRNLYPVDLDLMIDRAGLLGLSVEEMKAKLPLLRGASSDF